MGLLDDAIREHLDLKRRRGADPAEVERAEREALGPVRRNPNPNPDDLPAADEEAADESGFAYDQDAEEGWSHDSMQESRHHEPLYEEPAAGEPEPYAAAAGEPEPYAAAADEPEPYAAAADEPEPFPTAPPSSRPLTDLGGGETQEYNVEEYLTAEEGSEESGPAGDEDVLEETPDFLQDTPDHDRLWFEQRPPKDFDFDE